MFDQIKDHDCLRWTVKYGISICLPAMLAMTLTSGKDTPICLGLICAAYLFIGIFLEPKCDPSAVKRAAILPLAWSLQYFFALVRSYGLGETVRQTVGLHAADSEGLYQITVSAPTASMIFFWFGLKTARSRRTRRPDNRNSDKYVSDNE